jgi:transposase
MGKIYVVDLNKTEKANLVELTSQGQQAARKLRRANILLMANLGRTDREMASLLETSVATVERTRQRFVAGGLEFALNEQARSGRQPKVDDKLEAILTSLAQSKPPQGRKRWTLQLLANRLVELKVIETISDETVRRLLKKTNSSPGCARNGAFRRPLALNLSGAWKIFWICMPNRSTQAIR